MRIYKLKVCEIRSNKLTVGEYRNLPGDEGLEFPKYFVILIAALFRCSFYRGR